ncbi:tRNA-uridine aminocarboxypropyltransferase [Treponema porcinum]|nr:tRNA-uridine aminocarboxypropyltransferase [Treponema porcinum]
MSCRCQMCFRPANFCLCKYTKEIDSGVKFVFLMHPKEYRKQRTGTGRLAKISLKDSEILVGIDFSQNTRLQALLNDPRYFPVLLYPGEDAWNVKKEGFVQAAGGRILLAIIIDATWFCSRKVIQHSLFLLDLPKLSFAGEYRSIFTFKREPKPECVSTIETCYYLIKELQSAGLAEKSADPEPLMTVFKQMITDQLRAENERIAGIRPNTHPKDWKYTRTREIPDF